MDIKFKYRKIFSSFFKNKNNLDSKRPKDIIAYYKFNLNYNEKKQD